jgi:hypothetical protein
MKAVVVVMTAASVGTLGATAAVGHPATSPPSGDISAARHAAPSTAGHHRHARHHHAHAHRPAGIPLGAPAAAVRREPTLPRPRHRQWPFPNQFSRTSGTGRLASGASLWTDWLFDDHGATAPSSAPVSPASTQSDLAPTQGVAAYPAGPAKNNGADLFRAAVGMRHGASYWRVDWTTLVDPRVPIAEWTFDTDNRPGTGTAAWPAAAGVTSAGIDKALVVSAKGGAELIDTKTGKRTNVAKHGGRLTVNRKSRSFVVRIPRRLLHVSGRWRIRLASGLATANGKAFAEPDYSSSLNMTSAQEGQLPHVFNVTFRSLRQEPPVFHNGQSDAQVQQFAATTASTPVNDALGVNGLARFITGNFWMEDHQADALENGGDVSGFSRVIKWSRLRHRATTAQPRPRGYSNRWYASRLHLGQGVVTNDSNQPSGDLLPNYLTRVQPYAVYVPRHISLHRKNPLTWVLHSLGVNLNQYGALDPHQLQQECQQRHTICATTEGLGPDGWYFDKSEQDFWAVWHALASSYRLDPRRTAISGYSMGGWASYKLGLAHPDLFSQAMPLEGPPDCGIRFLALNGQEVTTSAGDGTTGHCSSDGKTNPLLDNARWLPYVVTQGGLDELVPAPSNVQATNTLRDLGYRYTFFFLPADDHLAYATQDRFGGVIKALGKRVPRVRRNPARIDYTWYPSLTSRKLGIGTTSAYWVTHMQSTTSKPGALASVSAHSFAIRDPAVKPVLTGPTTVSTPLPAERTTQRWKRGARPAAHRRLVLSLHAVRSLTINASRAHIGCVKGARIIATTDHKVRLRLTHLGPHFGHLSLRLRKGHSHPNFGCGYAVSG